MSSRSDRPSSIGAPMPCIVYGRNRLPDIRHAPGQRREPEPAGLKCRTKDRPCRPIELTRCYCLALLAAHIIHFL